VGVTRGSRGWCCSAGMFCVWTHHPAHVAKCTEHSHTPAHTHTHPVQVKPGTASRQGHVNCVLWDAVLS
jgi:hypothetical protein